MMDRGTAVARPEGARPLVSSPPGADSELLDRFLSEGDDDAFERLLGRHGPSVLSVCQRVLGTGQDADDAFQATFLILVRRGESIRETGDVGSWLRGVARRVAIRARIRAGERQRREAANVFSLDVASDTYAEDRELAPLLRAEVERLPEPYRRPIELCYWEGLSNEEAAGRLQCPTGTVKWRLSKGREMLRGRMAKLGFASLLLLLLGRGRAALAASFPAGARSKGGPTAPHAVPASLIAATLAIAAFARENPTALTRALPAAAAADVPSWGLIRKRRWLAVAGLVAATGLVAFWSLAGQSVGEKVQAAVPFIAGPPVVSSCTHDAN